MQFTFTYNYFDNRDSRSHDICVSSVKLGFFSVVLRYFRFLKVVLFGDKNDYIK